jgi:ATP-dependent RNA helicase DeaD
MTISSFSDLDLSPPILRALSDMGFEEPTPIQKQAIPFLMSGQDVAGQAQTGTGKTAAYAIPGIERCRDDVRAVQVLVLCPTRELCVQIAAEYTRLLKYRKEIHVLPIYGGQAIDGQIRELKRGIHICIGTPGRILDHIARTTLSLSSVHLVVLDEADQMLDMGFRPDIESILSYVPRERQTVIFSATLPKPILQISKRYQRDPAMVRIAHKELTGPGIDQFYIELVENAKDDALIRLLDRHSPSRAMVFANTRRMVDQIAGKLKSIGYMAEALHGDMKQRERDRVMAGFRSGSISILVASDVAARGIDVDDVEIVFNYDLPQDTEYYVHRIGRTARAGKGGKSISFVMPRDRWRMKDIQRQTNTHMHRMPIPTAAEIAEARAKEAINGIKTVIGRDDLSKYEKIIADLVSEGFDPVQLAAAFLKEQSSYTDTSGLNERSDSPVHEQAGHARLFISAGRKDGFSPRDIVYAVSSACNMPERAVGDIQMYPAYSFVQIPTSYVNRVISRLDGAEIRGVRIGVSHARPKQT